MQPFHSNAIKKNLKFESCIWPAGSNLGGSPEGTSPEILVLPVAGWKQQGGITLRRQSEGRNRMSYSVQDILSYACSLQPHKYLPEHMEKCPNLISCSDLGSQLGKRDGHKLWDEEPCQKSGPKTLQWEALRRSKHSHIPKQAGSGLHTHHDCWQLVHTFHGAWRTSWGLQCCSPDLLLCYGIGQFHSKKLHKISDHQMPPEWEHFGLC